MKVSELTGAQLDYWTARAEGIPAENLRIQPIQLSTDVHCVRTVRTVMLGPDQSAARDVPFEVLRYSDDWALGGALIDKYRPNIRAFAREYECDVEHAGGIETGYGDTALLALCRAVVHAAFGDDVDEVPVHPA